MAQLLLFDPDVPVLKGKLFECFRANPNHWHHLGQFLDEFPQYDRDQFRSAIAQLEEEGKIIVAGYQYRLDDSLTPPEKADVSESSPTVSTYSPGGKARGENLYFRLSWRDGKRIRHRHIRGGNIHSPVARSRVAQIKDAIARSVPLKEILSMV